MIKVFEALEEALRAKDLLLDAYRTENDKLRAQIRELQGGKENANSNK
jgi:L-rhamnose isomerase